RSRGPAPPMPEAGDRPPPAAPPGAAAEQPLEQVGEVDFLAPRLEPAARRPAKPARRPSAGPAAAITERHLRIAVLVDLAAVVPRPLVLVGEQVVGLRH